MLRRPAVAVSLIPSAPPQRSHASRSRENTQNTTRAVAHVCACVHCTTFWCTPIRVCTVQHSGAQPCVCTLYNVLVHSHACVPCTTFWCTPMRECTDLRSGTHPCVCALYSVPVHSHVCCALYMSSGGMCSQHSWPHYNGHVYCALYMSSDAHPFVLLTVHVFRCPCVAMD